jgi:hypothetical protein
MTQDVVGACLFPPGAPHAPAGVYYCSCVLLPLVAVCPLLVLGGTGTNGIMMESAELSNAALYAVRKSVLVRHLLNVVAEAGRRGS